MQLESKRTLPGRLKLVAVALLALSAVVGVWLHVSKGASTEVQSLAVEDSTSLLVRVPKAATTQAEAQQFCSQYGDALDVVGFVCDMADTAPVTTSVFAITDEDTGVVFQRDDAFQLQCLAEYGFFALQDSYQISFDVLIQGTFEEWGEIFILSAGPPYVGKFGRNPAVFLFPGTSKFHVVFASLANANGDICDGQTAYEAPIGEYVHVTLVNRHGGVEFYADGVLRCHKEGEFVGRNTHFQEASAWITSTDDWPAANALIKNFKIKTWQ